MGDASQRSRDDAVAWGIPCHIERRWPALARGAGRHRPPTRLARKGDPGTGEPVADPSSGRGVAARPAHRESRANIHRGVTSPDHRCVPDRAHLGRQRDLAHRAHPRPALRHEGIRAGPSIYASLPIWLTNVIVFGLWYWELDRGGPAQRQRQSTPTRLPLSPDVNAGFEPRVGRRAFLDYFYTSFTNATAFSPTDTMPLTAGPKCSCRSSPGLAGDRRRRRLPGREHLELTAAIVDRARQPVSAPHDPPVRRSAPICSGDDKYLSQLLDRLVDRGHPGARGGGRRFSVQLQKSKLPKADLRELALFSGASRAELDQIRRLLTWVAVPAGRACWWSRGHTATSS